MGTDIMTFLDKLSITQATIPPEASRIAGFFLIVQAVLIFLQKKNDPHKAIWEDISGVLLAGLIVFLFPELIKFAELVVNAVVQVEDGTSTGLIAQAMKTDLLGSETAEEEPSAGTSLIGWMLSFGLNQVTGGTQTGSYMFANYILKPLADIVNTLCFPTYMFIRGAGLKVAYLVAPLILMVGAFAPFRSLWKHWFMIYIALLVSGPALVLANNFCEEAFEVYIQLTDSPVLGFIMVALARFKIFQSVLDLSYRIFRA